MKTIKVSDETYEFIKDQLSEAEDEAEEKEEHKVHAENKSPYYKKTTDRITSIEITLKREDGGNTQVVFIRPEKIKDLIENEPFFRDLADLNQD